MQKSMLTVLPVPIGPIPLCLCIDTYITKKKFKKPKNEKKRKNPRYKKKWNEIGISHENKNMVNFEFLNWEINSRMWKRKPVWGTQGVVEDAVQVEAEEWGDGDGDGDGLVWEMVEERKG